MKKRLQILCVCVAALLAMRMMAQDTGAPAAGGGGDSSTGAGSAAAPAASDNSGAGQGNMNGATDQGASGGTEQGTNGGAGQGTDQGTNGSNGMNGNSEAPGLPQGGADQGQGGAGTGGLMEPGLPGSSPIIEPGAAQGTGEGSVIVPPPAPEGQPPGSIAPVPGTTPAPTPAGPNAINGGTQGAVATAPVSFTLPGGYGGSPSQTFTLGEGRLSKPPVTFTLSVSQGYDDNLFSADAHPVATPKPSPGPTPAEERVFSGNYYIKPPSAITPIFLLFQPKAAATPKPSPPLGVLGSPVSTATVAMQVQRGTPRTLFTMDLSVGALDYWDRPGGKVDYDGSGDLTMVHRLSPRATLSLAASMVYQKTPDFALINAPTNNGSGGAYLNGDLKADLTYAWSSRISTVSSYDVAFNLQSANNQDSLYTDTYGTQLRYSLSDRNTITANLRYSDSIYPSDAAANNSSLFYLIGVDTFISTKLRNSIDGGIETESFSSGGSSQNLPYAESATTLGLARGAELQWTNRVGSEQTGAANQKSESYRTGLSLSEPLSTKLTASISVAYNYIDTTGVGGYTQDEFQSSASLSYALSRRLSLSLSYTFTDLETTQLNTSYQRSQIYFGGTYTFQ